MLGGRNRQDFWVPGAKKTDTREEESSPCFGERKAEHSCEVSGRAVVCGHSYRQVVRGVWQELDVSEPLKLSAGGTFRDKSINKGMLFQEGDSSAQQLCQKAS